MKTTIALSFAAIGLLGLGLVTTSHAGLRYGNAAVAVFDGSAAGMIGGSRNTPDGGAIGCQVDATANSISMNCSATAADTGKFVQCSSSSPTLVQAAAAIQADNYVSFYWDASGTCTRLTVSTSSGYSPKQP